MYRIKVLYDKKKQDILLRENTNLLIGLSQNGFSLPASCGGRGTCNKCKVKLIEGTVDVKVENGYFKACEYFVKSDIKIQLMAMTEGGVSSFSTINYSIKKRDGYGLAIDIGTTTIAAYLLNLKNGKIVDKISQQNLQSSYGGDVLSRIVASNNGHLNDLQNLIIRQINKIIERFLKKHKVEKIEQIIISGNTTMLHLLKGDSPESIGVFPFIPIFLDIQKLGRELGLMSDNVVLLPSASAYVGSDIVAGVISSELRKSGKNNLLVDIGTNGEMVLATASGKLLACATAAGPAFEGANIEMGLGGISGAIDRIWLGNGKIEYSTINNRDAIGICGSGLVDLISIMKKNNIIDENGTFNDELHGKWWQNKIIDKKFYFHDIIYISQKDIREFQLAKSAIISGIMVLLETAGITVEEIDNVYLAGGFSFYLDIENAIMIGLLPKGFAGKIKNIGNASGQGVIMSALNEDYISDAIQIAKDIQIIELATNTQFMNYFVEKMGFE